MASLLSNPAFEANLPTEIANDVPNVSRAMPEKYHGLMAAYRDQRRTLRQAGEVPYPQPQQAITRPVELLEQVCEDAKGFYQRGWLLGTSGNLSVRDTRITAEKGLYFWLTASGLDKGELTPGDFLLMDRNGKPVTTLPVEPARLAPAKPSAEKLMHMVVYRMVPGTEAVYHVHSPAATWVSDRLTAPNEVTWLELPAVEMLKGLGAKTHDQPLKIPVIPNSQDMKELANHLYTLFAQPWELPVFVLRGHGAYTWGASTAQAKHRTEILDFLFQLMLWDRLSPSRPLH